MYCSYESCLNQSQENQEDHESELEQSYEQESDEQTQDSVAQQQNSFHPSHSDPSIGFVSQHGADNQPSPIEPDTSPRIFNRRLSTQDEDILLFAGQNPRKDDWPDISAAYSQKHGYRSPEACRKRYYILEPRNRDYTKRRNVSTSKGRRPHQTVTKQQDLAINDEPQSPSATTRTTTHHASPLIQQSLSTEPLVSDYQPSQPDAYTATTSNTSAMAAYNRTIIRRYP